MLWRAAALAAACFVSAAAAGSDIRSWLGRTPALVTTDLDGRKFELADLRGRVVILNFWATWCGPCKEELPSLQRLRDGLKGKPVDVFIVNYGEFPAKIAPFVAKEKIALPVLLDTQQEAAKQWRVGGLPMTILIDAEGHARYWVFGERDWSDADSVKLVEKLLAEGSRAGR